MIISITFNTFRSKIAVAMIILLLCTGIFGSYQKAHAFAWFLLAPAAAEAAYVGTMTAIFGGAALATAGIEYLDDNLDTVEATARETWGLMSADMKENFLQSLEQVEAGGVVAADAVTSFFDKLATVLSGDGTRSDEVKKFDRTLTGEVTIGGGGSSANVWAKAPYVFANGRSNFWMESSYNSATKKTTFTAGSATVQLDGDVGRNIIGNVESAVYQNKNIYDMIAVLRSYGVPVTGVGLYLDGKLFAGQDLPTGQLDNVRKNIDDAIATGGVRLGINPRTMVEPWANTATGNARVYENEDGSTDTMVLPDGVPIPRDQVNWRTRATGQATIDGVSVPVAVGADGALYDTRTGERVASREDAQARGIPVSPAIDKEWTWQDTLTKNPAKEETKDDTTTKPLDLSGFFAKLWEWLQKILNAILAIPKAIIDALKALLLLLFVPTDGFWTDNFNDIRLALTDKLGVDDLLEDVDRLGAAGGDTFKDVTVTLLGVAGLEIIDADSVNKVLSHIHKWVRGVVFPFLLFYNINQLYKLIRGTSLVEATRNLNRVKGE